MLDFRKIAQEAARAADDKKAAGIVLYDVRKESDVADYMLIAGADSSAQMRAIEDSVEERLREWGVKSLRRDGQVHSRWLALDYGGFVMHVLLPDARAFYRLEHMWENAKSVRWEEPAPARKPRTATRKKKR